MIKKLFLVSILFAGIFLFLSIASAVEDEEDSSEEGPATVKKLAGAYTLIEYGREEKFPLALLTAAEIIGTSQVVEDTQIPLRENTPSAQEDISPVQQEPYDLIEEAVIMSGNDPHVTALSDMIKEKIEEYQANPDSKGTHGAVTGHSLLPPYESEKWYIPCYPGEASTIEIIGDGNTNLDIFVYDKCNTLVASDSNKSDKCSVTWIPKWKEKFQAEVVNMNDKNNNYVIIYNY